MSYISVGLTTEARDALRSVTTKFTSPAERRLSMSEVLLSSLAVAQRHEDELMADLAIEPAGDHA